MMGDEVILDDVCTSFRTDSAKSRETVANVAKAGQLVLEVAGIARNKENQIVQIIRGDGGWFYAAGALHSLVDVDAQR